MDLNCDLGEGVGQPGHDAEIMACITSANIACGGHAGDRATMMTTVRDAIAAGVTIGAHPGYADRANFGRVSVEVDPAVLMLQVAQQVSALREVARSLSAEVRYLKLHGALYHDAGVRPDVARAVLDGVTASGDPLPVLAQAGALTTLAAQRGIPVFFEAFADRGYRPDGTLVPRGEPGALILEPVEVASRALDLIRHGRVRTDGGPVAVAADSVCIHGDAPGAVANAHAIADALAAAGIVPQAFVP